MTVAEFIADALLDLGVLGVGQTASGALLAVGRTRLLELFDAWNADGHAVYGDVFSQHTLTPSLQPHTIGPSTATYSLGVRPVAILSAQLIRSGIGMPLRIRDAAWWASVTQKTLSGTPSDLYYEPTWPNGSIYLWYVPSAADTLEIQRTLFFAAGDFDNDDTFTLPQGYQLAVRLSLQERLARALGRPWSREDAIAAEDARAKAFSNNLPIPHTQTRDAGIPGGQGSFYDYQSGRVI